MKIFIAIEIEGYEEAIVSRSGFSGSYGFEWATSTSVRIVQPIAPQSFEVEPFSRAISSGGASIVLRYAHDLLDVSPSIRTALATDLSRGESSSMNVDSTSSFPSAGFVWIGKEAVRYTGKTASSFTGLTRGYFGTMAALHYAALAGEDTDVFGSSPCIIGRRVIIRFADGETGVVYETMSAFVASVVSDGANYVLDLEGLPSILAKDTIGRGPFARGVVFGFYGEDGTFVESMNFAQNVVLLTEDAIPSVGGRGIASVKIGEELVGYEKVKSPAFFDSVVDSPLTTFFYGGNGFSVNKGVGFVVGMPITFTDSITSDTIIATITRVDYAGSYDIISHDHPTAYPDAGASVLSYNLTKIYPTVRGLVGSPISDHKAGEEFGEAVILQGVHSSLVLQLLLSGGSGGSYDLLAPEIGAGIDEDLVDVASFEALETGYVQLPISEPMPPLKILEDLQIITGAYIAPSRDGKLYATIPDVYPGADVERHIVKSDLVSAPSWKFDTAFIMNMMALPLPASQIGALSPSSISRYGPKKHELSSLAVSTQIPMSVMSRIWLEIQQSKDPRMVLDLTVRETLDWYPTLGSLVRVTMPHVPDLGGEASITSALFLLIGYSPASSGSAMTLSLLSLPSSDAFSLIGYVAPAALISGISGSDITVETDEFAPLSSVSWPIVNNGGASDADWFLDGDVIEFVDESTIGGSLVSATANITAIDYISSVITVDSVPGWLAIGDFLRLADYAATALGPNLDERIDWFCPLAPIAAIDPKKWGV